MYMTAFWALLFWRKAAKSRFAG